MTEFIYYDSRMCTDNPAEGIVIPIQAKVKVVNALTNKEKQDIRNIIGDVCHGIFAIFMMDTGICPGEFINLKCTDVDINNKVLYISSSKTEAGKRFIPLIPEAMRIILIQTKISDYVFLSINQTKVTKSVLRKMCVNIKNKSEISTFITPHMFRHTFATRLIENSCDYKALSSLLGNTSIYFTMHQYVNSQQNFLRSQISLLSK